MSDHLAVGTRVRLTHAVDRYPHFIVPAGATGTVVIDSMDVFAVRLDTHRPDLDDWDNELQWYPINGDDPHEDLAVILTHAERLDRAANG